MARREKIDNLERVHTALASMLVDCRRALDGHSVNRPKALMLVQGQMHRIVLDLRDAQRIKKN